MGISFEYIELLEFILALINSGLFGILSLFLYILAVIGILKALFKKRSATGFVALLLGVIGFFLQDYALHNNQSNDNPDYKDTLSEDDGYLLSTYYDNEDPPLLENSEYASMSIDSSYLELNVEKDNVMGTRIHLKLSSINLQDKEGMVYVYLETPEGNLIQDKNEKYCSDDGYVSVSEKWRTRYKQSVWEDFKLFLPNSEIHPLVGRNTYYVKVKIMMDSTILAEDYVGSFNMTGTEEFTFLSDSLDYTVINEEQGTMIYLTFSGKNVQDKEGEVRVYVESPKYTEIKDKNNKLRSSEGTVMVSGNWTSKHENAIWTNYKLFLPDSELHPLIGEHTYYLRAQILCDNKILSEKYIGSFNHTGLNGCSSEEEVKTEHKSTTAQEKPRRRKTKQCIMCMGGGQFICSTCYGSGKTMRQTIDLWGLPDFVEEICWNCRGTRRSSCPFCGGVGEIPNRISELPQRDVPDGTYECIGCERTGYSECTICGGLGVTSFNPVSYCRSCNGSGIGLCYMCGGLGFKYPGFDNGYDTDVREESHYCNACNGSGDCPVCKGSTQTKTKIQYHADWSKELINERCRTCKGTGKCIACDGDGKY